MTAFAFILGVVPLLTASGAGAEARKVMGMTVFSGMLIATILGVLPDSDAVRRRQKVIGGKQDGARASAAAGNWPTIPRRGPLTMPARALKSGLLLIVAPSPLSGCAAGANSRVRSCPRRPTTGSSRRLRRRRRSPSAWFQVLRRSEALQALIHDAIANNLDLRMRWRTSKRRAPSRHRQVVPYPQIDATANTGLRKGR